MHAIARVNALDNHTIDVQFSSGHVLLLDLNALSNNPACAAILRDGSWYLPKTDGLALWWENGPRFSVEDLTKMIAETREGEGTL